MEGRGGEGRGGGRRAGEREGESKTCSTIEAWMRVLAAGTCSECFSVLRIEIGIQAPFRPNRARYLRTISLPLAAFSLSRASFSCAVAVWLRSSASSTRVCIRSSASRTRLSASASACMISMAAAERGVRARAAKQAAGERSHSPPQSPTRSFTLPQLLPFSLDRSMLSGLVGNRDGLPRGAPGCVAGSGTSEAVEGWLVGGGEGRGFGSMGEGLGRVWVEPRSALSGLSPRGSLPPPPTTSREPVRARLSSVPAFYTSLPSQQQPTRAPQTSAASQPRPPSARPLLRAPHGRQEAPRSPGKACLGPSARSTGKGFGGWGVWGDGGCWGARPPPPPHPNTLPRPGPGQPRSPTRGLPQTPPSPLTLTRLSCSIPHFSQSH